MAEHRKKMVNRAATREMGPSRRANGHNEGGAPAGPLSWYTAQPAQPGVRYALTGNGYVTLGSMS